MAQTVPNGTLKKKDKDGNVGYVYGLSAEDKAKLKADHTALATLKDTTVPDIDERVKALEDGDVPAGSDIMTLSTAQTAEGPKTFNGQTTVKQFTDTVYAVGDGTTIDSANGMQQTKTINGNTALTLKLSVGETVLLALNNAGAGTITYTGSSGETVSWAGGIAPTLPETGQSMIGINKINSNSIELYRVGGGVSSDGLPIATATDTGVVKGGGDINVAADGTMSLDNSVLADYLTSADAASTYLTRNTAQSVTAVKTFEAVPLDKVYNETGNTISIANGGIQTKTFTANTTLAITVTDGGTLVLYAVNGGAYTIIYSTTVKWKGGEAPALTASGTDRLVFQNVGGTIYGSYELDLK